jgi:5-methylcytosine-specific restriction protein A
MRKLCSRPPCASYAIEGKPRCVKHEHIYVTGKALKRADRPGDGAQRRLRRRINNHTHGELMCPRCKRGALGPAQLEVDHVRALVDGGHDTDVNVWAICLPCHRAKTAEEARDRARIKRAEGRL